MPQGPIVIFAGESIGAVPLFPVASASEAPRDLTRISRMRRIETVRTTATEAPRLSKDKDREAAGQAAAGLGDVSIRQIRKIRVQSRGAISGRHQEVDCTTPARAAFT